VEFPNGGQVEVTNTAMCHVWSDLLWPSVSTVEVFTLNSPVTKHPPLATSPQSVRPSASSSTDQKPCTALYLSTNVLQWSQYKQYNNRKYNLV